MKTQLRSIPGGITNRVKVTAEAGFPIPKGGPGPEAVYPWKTMRVGESFTLRGSCNTGMVHISNIRYEPKHFLSRMRVEGGRRVRRVWRTK